MGRKSYTNLILYSTVTILLLKHNCHNIHLNTIKASDKSEKEGERYNSHKPLRSSCYYVHCKTLYQTSMDTDFITFNRKPTHFNIWTPVKPVFSSVVMILRKLVLCYGCSGKHYKNIQSHVAVYTQHMGIHIHVQTQCTFKHIRAYNIRIDMNINTDLSTQHIHISVHQHICIWTRAGMKAKIWPLNFH